MLSPFLWNLPMTDNQLNDGGKLCLTYLEMFWGQTAKMTSQFVFMWRHSHNQLTHDKQQ